MKKSRGETRLVSSGQGKAGRGEIEAGEGKGSVGQASILEIIYSSR